MPPADGSTGHPIGAGSDILQGRRWPDEGCSRIPNWVYTEPEIFAREQGRIFEGPGWLYACLEAEIPKPGDFKRSRLGTKEVVAVRDTSGEVSILLNRCAHRSAQFCSVSRGTAKEFVCPYHQWTYDLSGKLLGVPFRRGYRGQGGMPADFRPEEHGLQRLAVTRRHGVVFASFSESTEPLADYLGETMLGYFDRVFADRELVVLGYLRQRIPSNWKLMFENIKDPYHASLLHVFLVTFGLFRLDQKSAIEMDATGRHAVLVSRRGDQQENEATRQMRAFKPNFALRDPRLLDPVREFAGDATVVMQTLWPNLIVQQQSNTLAMRQIVPIDAGTLRPCLDLFRLCRRHARDAAAPTAPSQPDGARRPRLARRQRGDAAFSGRDRQRFRRRMHRRDGRPRRARRAPYGHGDRDPRLLPALPGRDGSLRTCLK